MSSKHGQRSPPTAIGRGGTLGGLTGVLLLFSGDAVEERRGDPWLFDQM